MRRAKARVQKAKRSFLATSVPEMLPDLRAVRKRITELVRDEAEDIVRGVIEEAKGHCTNAKYLLEIAGLYARPAAQEEPAAGDALARTLLRRLGLAEEPIMEPRRTEDCLPESPATHANAVE